MSDDPTMPTAEQSRHIGIWIAAEPQAVYRFAADPRELPRWAAGLAAGGLRETAAGWVADSPMGEVTVEFSPANDFGVLDHVVRLPTGEAVYNPVRIIPAGDGEARCEVVFTLRRRLGMTDEEFDADAAAVVADLNTLRQLLER